MNHGLGTGYRATTTFGLYLEKYGSNRSQSAGIRTSTFDGFGLHASKFGFVHLAFVNRDVMLSNRPYV